MRSGDGYRVGALAGLLAMFAGMHSGASSAASAAELMCLGKSLMPAWGFHRSGEEYGGTRPLNDSSAWTAGSGRHVLTWVADFSDDAIYHVWIRRYGGYGSFDITVDEKPLEGGRGGPGGGRYVWNHVGVAKVSAGQHHVDIAVSNGFLDAILFTTDAAADPENAKLPPPAENPNTDLPRTYRDDSSLNNEAGFAVGAVKLYEILRYDWMPAEQDVIDRLKMWGAAGQYIAWTFAVRALTDAPDFRVEISELVGPHAATIPQSEIDVRVVHVRTRRVYGTNSAGERFMPQLLLRDDRDFKFPPKAPPQDLGSHTCLSRIPAHESRQFWITVHVPESTPAGRYEGRLQLIVPGNARRQVTLPLTLDVLDVDLKPADGFFSIYHMVQPLDPNTSHYGDNNFVTPRRYLTELQDMRRHGLNATTMYGGVGQIPYLREAGLTQWPCMMLFPRGREEQELATAREWGYGGLHYYGYDEPAGENIARCRQEAISRRERGLTMMIAINSRQAYDALWDVVDHPIYAMSAFGDPRAGLIAKVKEKGFTPISYWTTGPGWPLVNRIYSGPYNTACGFKGCIPWAYRDWQDKRQWENGDSHGVSYFDDAGNPIPTLDWESYRDGIDDLRYMQALDRAIAAADQAGQSSDALTSAKELRRQITESLFRPSWQQVNSVVPGELDETRRAVADAIVLLRQRPQ